MKNLVLLWLVLASALAAADLKTECDEHCHRDLEALEYYRASVSSPIFGTRMPAMEEVSVLIENSYYLDVWLVGLSILASPVHSQIYEVRSQAIDSVYSAALATDNPVVQKKVIELLRIPIHTLIYDVRSMAIDRIEAIALQSSDPSVSQEALEALREVQESFVAGVRRMANAAVERVDRHLCKAALGQRT